MDEVLYAAINNIPDVFELSTSKKNCILDNIVLVFDIL